MIEEVGGVGCGLAAMELSPDMEILMLVTREMAVVTMTRDYTPVQEISLLESESGSGAQVAVGWGSKETQFHGSEGKEGRSVKTEVGEAASEDDRVVRLSWRGDGEMVSVSFLITGDENKEHRRIRVLDRSGSLYSLSQNMPGLQWTLAWRPSGSVIAAVVKKPNKQMVSFFEKNGLEHGGFEIDKDILVRSLDWSPDSSVLCVSTDSALYLFTTSNYHWYLKQRLDVGTSVLRVRWSEDSETIRCLCVGDSEAVLHSWRLSWVTNTSSLVATKAGLASVTVVDGTRLQVTPFSQVTVPPPSSAFTLTLVSPVSQVVFSSGPRGQDNTGLLGQASADVNSFLAVTCDGRVSVFSVTSPASPGCSGVTVTDNNVTASYKVQYHKHRHVGTCSPGSEMVAATNIVWIGPHLLSSKAEKLMLHDNKQILAEVSLEADIYTITPVTHGPDVSAMVQLCDGTLVRVRIEDGRLSVEDAGLKWPGVCSTVLSCDQGIIGLSDRFKLYLDTRELASNVTSLSLHTNFLLVTTLDHQLLTLQLSQLPRSETAAVASTGQRRVERGCRLVVSVPHDSKTVLQMPRGNIEVIHPRSLSIVLLADHLDSGNFKEAFMLARTQRINLNLLVDHNMNRFLASISQLVEQISRPDYLSIFIADIMEEDVCTTLYADQYKSKQYNPTASRDKVNRVCVALREELENKDAKKYFLPILATYVRDGKNLEQALAAIKSYKDAGVKNLVDEGLRFLATMVDINVLFNVALGTYDLQMVLMVAEKSQKDPKEYLAFLNSFRKMEENFRKFSIDQHLARNEKALGHIVACPEMFDTCLKHVTQHRLYKQALKLLASGSERHMEVCQSYGEYLESKKYHEEASIMFQKAGNTEKAISEAQAGMCWQRAGHLARAAGWSREQLSQLYRQLSGQLETAGKYREAATVLRDWCQDEEEALAVLVRGCHWTEAVTLVRNISREDLVETHLGPGLLERREKLMASIQSLIDQVSRHVARLEVVITARRQDAGDIGVGEEIIEMDRNVEDAEMFSDTTSFRGSVTSTVKSTSTLKTRTTTRSKSSKNRRKQERKIYTTKEGSLYEDVGIIAAIHDLISSVPLVREEIREVVRAAVDIGRENLVPDTQARMEELLALIDRVSPSVWRLEDKDKEEERFGPEATVEDIIRGRAAKQEYSPPLHILPPQLRYPPVIKKDNSWKLEIY